MFATPVSSPKNLLKIPVRANCLSKKRHKKSDKNPKLCYDIKTGKGGIPVSNFTRNAIKQSFIKLLSEHPYSQITVKDIVGDCGINRNSFYYHYQDLPALLEEIVRENCDDLIAVCLPRMTLAECMDAVIQRVAENRRLIMHIYKSMNRDVFERYLWKLSEYIVSAFLSYKLENRVLRETDKKTLFRFYQCEYFGVALGWLESGMNEEVREMVIRIAKVKEGQIEEEIDKFTSAQ